MNKFNDKKSRNSIGKMMMSILIPISIVICVLLASGAMYFSRVAMIDTGKKLLTETSRLGGEEIYKVLKEKLNGVEIIASIPIMSEQNISLEEKLKILQKNADVQKNNNMGIVYGDGIIHYLNKAEADIKDRDFYIEAMKGKTYISKPFLSRIDGKLIIALSAPITDGDKTIGAVVALREGNDLSNISNGIKLLDTGEAFVVDSDGTFIASKDESKINGEYNLIKSSSNEYEKNLGMISANMIEGGNRVEELKSSSGNSYIGYAPVGDLGWSMGLVVKQEELLSALNAMDISLIITGFIAIIMIIIVIIRVSSKISKPVKAVNNIILEMEQGDFTKDIHEKYLNDSTEIGVMSRALNTMMDKINTILKNVKGNSHKIDTQAAALAAISEEMSASTNNIVIAIDQVAKGTTSQATDLVEIATQLNEFGKDINTVNDNVGKINILASEIGQRSIDGNEEINSLTQVIENLNNNFKSFSTSLDKMTDDIKQVNQMTDLINSIADETNLLALNAAIEAARAGEAGKGFSVVADEIRKLAEMSRDSSQNISDISKNILKNTNEINGKTSLISGDINKQNEVVNKTIKAFNNISEGITIVAPKISDAVRKFDSINTKKENILTRIENISAVSEEVSATAEEISASSQEINSALEEVAVSAQNLTVSTNEMNEQLKFFKIK